MSGYGDQDSYGGGERGGYGGREQREDRGGYGGDQQEGYGGRQEQGGYGGGGQGQGGYGGQDQEGEYRDTRHHEQQGGRGQPTGYDDDLSSAASHAQEHSGGSGDQGMFGNVLGYLQQNKHSVSNQQVDEEGAVQAHQQYFGGGGGGGQQADSSSMGAAAAMQALKHFTGGQSSGGGGQNEFIGMAMGQASKLFEQQSSQGNVASGESKESAVQKAGEMALKFYMKNQMSGGSSGASGLMGMASKFF